MAERGVFSAVQLNKCLHEEWAFAKCSDKLCGHAVERNGRTGTVLRPLAFTRENKKLKVEASLFSLHFPVRRSLPLLPCVRRQGDNCYLCEKCGQRVTAQRRCAIKQLPPTLIVHLKRFEFDLSTMSRHKLNHRCSFPMELDMSPWTLEVC